MQCKRVCQYSFNNNVVIIFVITPNLHVELEIFDFNDFEPSIYEHLSIHLAI